jgi:uncharacterized protein (TIGR02996 family)
MFDTQQDLLNAIIANPDDDAPRLIYADWLDEQGDELRAEFIRLQCVNKSLNRSSREMDLGHINRIGWFDADNTWSFSLIANYEPTNDPSRCKIVRRGFIDEIHCTTADFIQYCHDIAAKHPVRNWVLTDFKPTFSEFFYSIWDGDKFDNMPDDGDLPSQVYNRLKGGRFRLSFLNHTDYATEQELFADLEQACFHHARSKLDFLQPKQNVTIGDR